MPVLPPSFSSSVSSAVAGAHTHDSHASPTETLSHAAHTLLRRLPALVQPRQQGGGVLPIPAQYQGLRTDRSPGVVVGIVLGSVAGFLLLIWLLWIASNGGGFIRSSGFVEEDVVSVRRPKATVVRSHRSRRTPEMVRTPPRERVIRTERIVRDSVPPPRDRSRMRETIVVEEDMPPSIVGERRVAGDDIIEVMEEHDSLDIPPPRRKSRRGSYRSVDPY